MTNITQATIAQAAENAAHSNYGNGLADAGYGNIDESNLDETMIRTPAFKDGFNEGVQWYINTIESCVIDTPITIKAVIRLCNDTGSALSHAHELTLKSLLPKLVEKYAAGQKRWGAFAAIKLKEQEKAVHVMKQILRAGVSTEVTNEINAYLSEIEPATDEEKTDLRNDGMPEKGSEGSEKV